MMRIVAVLFSVAFLAWGCQKEAEKGAEKTAQQAEQEKKQETPKPAPGQDTPTDDTAKPSEHAHGDEHEHGEEDHEKTAPTLSDAPLDEKLGEPLSGAEGVDVLDLSKNPSAYAGKTIRIEGTVTDMCYHRRGWFGIASSDNSRVIRVIAMPKFQVPETAVGSRAIAEGVVEVQTIPAEEVPHYRESHKFIADDEVAADGTISQAIVRVSGAEFKR
ncbi:MAG: hypothetical protein RBU37_05460 [Myxococcota bacterium]|jgi:hypothetical protein|nr:hypothetical protein [Myxococcota bacterium]